MLSQGTLRKPGLSGEETRVRGQNNAITLLSMVIQYATNADPQNCLGGRENYRESGSYHQTVFSLSQGSNTIYYAKSAAPPKHPPSQWLLKRWHGQHLWATTASASALHSARILTMLHCHRTLTHYSTMLHYQPTAWRPTLPSHRDRKRSAKVMKFSFSQFDFWFH